MIRASEGMRQKSSRTLFVVPDRSLMTMGKALTGKDFRLLKPGP
jgi:hypothetical protein